MVIRRRRPRLKLEHLEARQLLTTVPLGELNSGVGVDDDATGTGYVMYSEESVQELTGRFSGALPSAGNSDHLIAVRLQGAQWQYNNNRDWYDFTSVATDRLLAELDFTADTTNSLLCHTGTVSGIATGYADSVIAPDILRFQANVWNGEAGEGEFFVSGTLFEDAWTNCGSLTQVIPDTGASGQDLITDRGDLILRGRFGTQTLPDPPTLTVSVGSSTYVLGTDAELTASGLDWTLDLRNASLLEGTHAVVVQVNGDVVSGSAATVVVDETIPNVSIDDVVGDTGPNPDDFVTVDTRVQITGQWDEDPSSTLVVDVGGHSYNLDEPELTTDGNAWTLDLELIPLPGGTHTITATATDAAGNFSTVTQTLQIITVSIDSVTDDTGVDGDFITNDGQVIFAGTYTAGTDLSFNFNSGQATYSTTTSSPEITLDGSNWTLDLTALNLPQSPTPYTLSATADDGLGNIGSDIQDLTISDACYFAHTYELIDSNDNPISSIADVFIDSTGAVSTNLDLNARKVPINPANEYWVDDVAVNGTGTLASPFNDIWKAFDALGPSGTNVGAATINVAPGYYIWGLRSIPDNVGFDLNIIGSGTGTDPNTATIIRYDQDKGVDTSPTGNPLNRYTAQLRGNSTYIEGITFDGAGVDDNNPSTPDEARIVLDVRNGAALTIVDSEFKNAGSDGDGMNIVNISTVVVYNSVAHNNDGDGFSYTSGSAGQPMEILEIDIHAYDNGLNGEWNSQGSTTHKSADIVRIGSLIENNPTNISDVSSGDSWNLGLVTRNALANVQNSQYLNLNFSGDGTGWVIGGDHGEGVGVPTAVNATEGAQIRYVSQFSTLDPITHIVTGSSSVDNTPLVPIPQPCVASVSIDQVSEDFGVDGDFLTFDQELIVTGTFVGNSVQVDFDGTTYTTASPELTVDEFNWTLDLTNTLLPNGSYSITATATDDFLATATDVATVTIDCDSASLELQNNPVLMSIGSHVYVESTGEGSVQIDLEARQIESVNNFWIDERFTGTGTEASPFNDIPSALMHIDVMGYEDAVLHVAEGDYTWGDTIDPDTGSTFAASLTVIGSGSGLTRVLQTASDSAAASFHEAGRSLYVEGITFVGLGSLGTNNVNENVFDARNGSDLTLVDTEFRNATDGDGLFVTTFDTVVVYDSRAIDNDADGFSYTNPNDGGAPMYVLEVGVVAAANGQDGQPSSQGSTMHRHTEIVRVNGTYANNPTNIEDTGLTSWNVNLTVQRPTVFRGHEGGYVNFEVRGDKIEATDGTAWFISGTYNDGGIVHVHATNANDVANTPINGFLRYSSLFDIVGHPPAVLTEDSPDAFVIHPADDSQLGVPIGPCDLVAHWDFEGDVLDKAFVGAVDDDGILNGASLAFGGLGEGVLRLGGSGDRLELPSSSDINALFAEKTFALSFYPEDLTTLGRQVIYQQGGTVRGVNVYLENTLESSVVVSRIVAGAWDDAASWQGTWLSSTSVVADQWNHVAFVVDSSNSQVQLFVNGTSAATGFGNSLRGHNLATFGSVTLGTRFDDGAGGFVNSTALDSFVGYVDDARIYDRVLSNVEISSLSAAVLTQPSDIQSDLVAYWDFDGGADDKATEGVLLDNGILVGTQLISGGLGSNAIFFSGDGEMMQVPTSPDINKNFTKKTIALWFFAEDVTTTSRQVIYQQGGFQKGLNIYVESGVLHAGGWNTTAGWNGTWLVDASITSQAWNHVTLVLDPAINKLSLYVNGALSSDGLGNVIQGHNPASLGGVTNGTRYANGDVSFAENSFVGLVDDVRIYNRNLSIFDVNGLTSSTPGQPSGNISLDLTTHWDFNSNANDQASGGSQIDDGTLTGATLASGGLGTSSALFSSNGDIMTAASSVDINLGFVTNRSIALWFYPQNLATTSRQVIYQQGGTVRGLNIYLEDGVLYAGGWDQSSSWSGTWLASDVGEVTEGQWNHVALILNSTTAELDLFINGVARTNAGFANVISGHNPATLGAATQGSRYFLSGGFENSTAQNSYLGYIDEVRIYNRTLNFLDIQSLASASPSNPT